MSESTRRRHLVVRPINGIGNRARALASAIKIWKEQDIDLTVLVKGLAEFWELFSPLKGVNYETEFPSGFEEEQYGVNTLKEIKSPTYVETPHAFGLGSKVSMKELTRFFPKPSKMVCDEVDDRVQQLAPGTVGLHIRRTDNTKATKFSPLQLFESHVRSVSNPIYVCTDEPVIALYLKDKYGDRVSFRCEILEGQEGLKEAFIQILTLARCEYVLGSYWSSFSDMAILLNKSKASRILKL